MNESWRLDLGLTAATLLALAGTGQLVLLELGRAPARLAERGAVVGHAAELVGAVRRRHAEGLNWEGLGAGAPLYCGDGLFVPEEGALAVTLADGSRLAVGANSLVIIDRPVEVSDPAPMVELRRGSLSGTAAGALQVRSGAGALRLGRGSRATLTRRGDAADVAVEAGQVTVSTSAGEVALGAQEGLALDGDRVTARERFVVTLTAPAPEAVLYTARPTTAVAFAWQGLAAGLRLELSADGEPAAGLRRQPIDGMAAEVDALGPGRYSWRLVDADGRARSATRSFVVVLDHPPVPVRPVADETILFPDGTQVSFFWTAIPGTAAYELELARDPTFGAVAHRARVNEPLYLLRDRLGEGVYHWRVRVAPSPERAPPWSTPVAIRLVVEPLLPAPALLNSEVQTSPPAPASPPPAPGPEEGSLWWRLLLGGVAHAAVLRESDQTLDGGLGPAVGSRVER